MATPERELAPEAPIAPTPAARTGLPPGPATWPPLQMLRYARRPYGSIEENARQFGSCWTVRAPGQPPIVSFSDPDAIKVIFTADVDEVHGGEGQAPILGPILGWKSVLVLDGAGKWAAMPAATRPRRGSASAGGRAPKPREAE